MSRVLLLDTAVLAYAVGDAHHQRAACRAILAAAAAGDVELHLSVEGVQEFLFHRMRRGSRDLAVRQARDVADLCVLHAFDAAVLSRALELVAGSALPGRDAVHAATALVHGIDAIVSPDPDFDDVPGLRRVDPRDAL